MQTVTRVPTQPLPLSSESNVLLYKKYLAFALLFLMLCSLFFLDAVLPLRNLWFYDALLKTPFQSWLLLPTHLVFPGKSTVLFQPGLHINLTTLVAAGWQETLLLAESFAAVFLCYFLAVRLLPAYITQRFLLFSTLMLGVAYLLVPITTSQDIFSYIIYARMGAIYHLNPLTTLPIAIRTDPVYPYIYWVKQPSAYGPTWAMITCALQWLAQAIGLQNALVMIPLLRLFSLAMHLGSTARACELLQRDKGSQNG